jgi:hypothetical protein
MFRRNTLLSLEDQHIVVSTVGAYRYSHHEEIQNIGPDRYYETMAFIGQQDGPYLEADVCKQVEVHSEWAIRAGDPKGLPNDIDNLANQMHEQVVQEITDQFAEYYQKAMEEEE